MIGLFVSSIADFKSVAQRIDMRVLEVKFNPSIMNIANSSMIE